MQPNPSPLRVLTPDRTPFVSRCVRSLEDSHTAPLRVIMPKRARDEGEEENEDEEASRPSWRNRVASATTVMLEAIEARKGALEAKAAKLGKAREALAKEKAKARQEYGAATAPNPESWVKLCVGGQALSFRRSSFLEHPERGQESCSYLAAVLGSGDWDKRLPKDQNGRVLLDESPVIFQAVMTAILTAKVSESVSDLLGYRTVMGWLTGGRWACCRFHFDEKGTQRLVTRAPLMPPLI